MPKTPSPSCPADVPPTYEVAVQELETLLLKMESGQLALDDLLAQYQRGAELLRFCRDKLDAVEQQVRVMEDGGLKPWNGTAG